VDGYQTVAQGKAFSSPCGCFVHKVVFVSRTRLKRKRKKKKMKKNPKNPKFRRDNVMDQVMVCTHVPVADLSFRGC
jgi:hypothetical protein